MPRAKTQGAQDCFPKRYILVKCPMGRKICNASAVSCFGDNIFWATVSFSLLLGGCGGLNVRWWVGGAPARVLMTRPEWGRRNDSGTEPWLLYICCLVCITALRSSGLIGGDDTSDVLYFRTRRKRPIHFVSWMIATTAQRPISPHNWTAATSTSTSTYSKIVRNTFNLSPCFEVSLGKVPLTRKSLNISKSLDPE